MLLENNLSIIILIKVNANGCLSLLSNSFTSTSTPMSTSGSIDGDQSKLSFVQNAAKRDQHQQLLDASLFEYSTNSNCMGKQSSRVEYAAMIYDSLSSNGLSISNGTQLMQNTTSLLQCTLNDSKLRSAIKKNRAFQTEPTPDTTVLEKKMLKQQTGNAKPSTSNKKWRMIFFKVHIIHGQIISM